MGVLEDNGPTSTAVKRHLRIAEAAAASWRQRDGRVEAVGELVAAALG